MKSTFLKLTVAAFLVICALPSEALIVLGGDEGHTSAPPDDPGWDNVGYVRSSWSGNSSRASGVYIGDGWVLTAYHVIYYDAPNGIVFNVEPNKTYPVDTESYVRLDTNSFTRFADSPDWINPAEFKSSASWTSGEWSAILRQIAPEGADLAMFRLSDPENYPNIDPVSVTELSTQAISLHLSMIDREVTAIATGRPREEELSYWTTNSTGTLVEWNEGTDGPTANAPYSGYKDWPDTSYDPICRWGKNELYPNPTTVTRAPFGSTICLPTVFNDYGNGGTNDTFQMAGLDSGGGVFFKATGKWELLGMLIVKQVSSSTTFTTDTRNHPFGSYSMICDLSRYRDQIMNVTDWPDLSVNVQYETWLETGQPAEILVITTNNTETAVTQSFTNTLLLALNGQMIDPVHFVVPGLTGNSAITNSYTFTPETAGAWYLEATTDSGNQVCELIELRNQVQKQFYSGPDLMIIGSSPSVINTAAGSQVSVQITSKNQGLSATEDTFKVSLYLGTNKLFSTLSEPELEEFRISSVTLPSLDPLSSIRRTFSLSAPATETGRYYLQARIDSSSTVPEAKENNNWGPLSEIRLGPDLVIAGSSPANIELEPGAEMSIDVIIKNEGSAAAPGSYTGLYVVNESFSEGADTPRVWSQCAPIPSGQMVTNTFTFTAPTNLQRYLIIAKADDNDQMIGEIPINGLVQEAVEDNNEGYSSGFYSILQNTVYTVTTNNGAVVITDYSGPGGNVNIPPSINGLPVTGIGDSAFAKHKYLTGITMPDTITTIADQAFAYCTQLTNVVLSTNLTILGYGGIGAGAFRGCTKLPEITIPASVINIGNWAFGDCTGLTRVTFKNNIIGYGMFARCTGLTEINVPANVTTIRELAFTDCTNLSALFFTNSPPAVAANAFINAPPSIYYLPEASGWPVYPDTWADRPTLPWKPMIQIGNKDGDLPGNPFNFEFTWSSGKVVVVESSTNLTQGLWVPMQTNTIGNSPIPFSDPQSAQFPGRFYRLRSIEEE